MSTPGPGPVIHPEVAPFWEAAASGILRLPYCVPCDLIRFPVTSVCPSCLSGVAGWRSISPWGRVRTAIVVERARPGSTWNRAIPFATGLVDLDDGVRMPGRLICDCGEVLKTGAAVRFVTAGPVEGISTYAFAHVCRLSADA